jgi:glycosyltransferase involved in cell wall biosynthesis
MNLPKPDFKKIKSYSKKKINIIIPKVKIDYGKIKSIPLNKLKQIKGLKKYIPIPNIPSFGRFFVKKDYKSLTNTPLISIVIPAYNEEKIIENTLKSIEEQSYKNYELIVVNNDSEDKTEEIAKKYTTKVIWCPRQGFSASAARNEGVKHAKGDILVILDADINLDDKDILYKVVFNLNQDIGAGTFKMKPMEGTIKGKTWIHFINLIKRINPYPVGFFFCKKEHFNAIGGYDIKIGSTEECDLIERMKKECKIKLFKNAEYQYCERRFNKQGMIYPIYEWTQSYFRKKDTKDYETVR